MTYAPVLTAVQIERIRLLACARQVTAGEVLYDPDDDTPPAFIVISGSIRFGRDPTSFHTSTLHYDNQCVVFLHFPNPRMSVTTYIYFTFSSHSIFLTSCDPPYSPSSLFFSHLSLPPTFPPTLPSPYNLPSTFSSSPFLHLLHYFLTMLHLLLLKFSLFFIFPSRPLPCITLHPQTPPPPTHSHHPFLQTNPTIHDYVPPP